MTIPSSARSGRRTPHVIVTSNRTRELPDACAAGVAFWLPYPTLEQEIEVLHARVPGLSERLAVQIARVMQALRGLPLQKAPGVAESLDWAMALMSLHRGHLDRQTVDDTIGCVLKVHEDHEVLTSQREALDAALHDPPARPDAGGYGLATDFGFGSVSTPRG